MGLTKTKTAPMPGATQNPGAPAELLDETTTASAAQTAVEEESAFDNTGVDTAAGAMPATAAASTSGKNLAAMSGVKDDGFEGLDDKLKFGSFPTIKLETGKLVIPDVGDVDSFECQLLGAKPKWIHKTVKVGENEEFFYAYDQTHATDGTPIADKIKAWKEDGLQYAGSKEYMEVVCMLIDVEGKDGELALLSIPPASTGKLAGYRTQLGFSKKARMQQVVTTVSVGDKIKTKAGKVFNPWNFKFARWMDGEGPAAQLTNG